MTSFDSDIVDVVLVAARGRVATEPLDGLGKSAREIILRSPPGELPDFSVCAQEAAHFAVLRPDALILCDDTGVRPDLTHELGSEIPDGDLILGRNVDFLADCALTSCDREEACDRILHVVEIPGRQQ